MRTDQEHVRGIGTRSAFTFKCKVCIEISLVHRAASPQNSGENSMRVPSIYRRSVEC